MSDIDPSPPPVAPKPLYMTVDELRDRCIKLFGKRGWKKTLAREIKRDESTIRRWCAQNNPIPGYVGAVLDSYERQRKLDRLTRKVARL